MKISMEKKYRTRDREKVRVICTNRNAKLPVVALIGCDERVNTFTKEGRFNTLCSHSNDLVEVSKWGDFQIDEPVMGRQGTGIWVKGYFAGLSVTGRPQTWDNGKTSWTGLRVGFWDECRRPTEEELNNG